MVAKSTNVSNIRKAPPAISSTKGKPKVKTIKVSLGFGNKKSAKSAKQQKVTSKAAKTATKSKLSAKQQITGVPKKVAKKTNQNQERRTLKQEIVVTKKGAKKAAPSKNETPKREVLNAQNRKPIVKTLLGKLKKLRTRSQTSSLGKKVEAIKAQKAKSEKTAKVQEKTDVAAPIYLTTPTMEMLKVFRTAAEETKRKQLQQRKAKGSGRCFLAKPGKNTKKFSIDLRVHSPATDGYFSTGGVEPAAALVRLAKAKGIDLLGITDSFSGAMLDEIKRIAQGIKITILPGLELSCRLGYCDDFQIIALFPETYTGNDVEKVLDDLAVPCEYRGRPSFNLKADFDKVLKIVESRGGVVIPSHVDKTPNRQAAISELVENYGFHCFDLVHPENTEYFKDFWPDGGFTFFSFSNANSLAQVGTRVTKARLVSPSFAGIKQLATRRQ